MDISGKTSPLVFLLIIDSSGHLVDSDGFHTCLPELSWMSLYPNCSSVSPLTPPLKKYLVRRCFEAWVKSINNFFPELLLKTKNVLSCSVISDFSKQQVSIFKFPYCRGQWSSFNKWCIFPTAVQNVLQRCIWVCATKAICTSVLAYCSLKIATVGIYGVGEFASLSRIGQQAIWSDLILCCCTRGCRKCWPVLLSQLVPSAQVQFSLRFCCQVYFLKRFLSVECLRLLFWVWYSWFFFIIVCHYSR